MKNLFRQKDYDAITMRVHAITPHANRLWGKMDAHQMIVHLKDQLDIALGNKNSGISPSRNMH